MQAMPEWEHLHPDFTASFKYRRSVLRDTPFDEVVTDARGPGQQWREVAGRRLAKDVRNALLARGFRFAHRSSCCVGAIRLYTEVWAPAGLPAE